MVDEHPLLLRHRNGDVLGQPDVKHSVMVHSGEGRELGVVVVAARRGKSWVVAAADRVSLEEDEKVMTMAMVQANPIRMAYRSAGTTFLEFDW